MARTVLPSWNSPMAVMTQPASLPALDLAHDQTRLRLAVRQVEAHELLVRHVVDEPAERVAHRRELLPAEAVDDEDQALDVLGQVGQVDVDDLVVTLAGAGQVVAAGG